jgi:ethanolamine utilization protein EutP (predicted NTPase)
MKRFIAVAILATSFMTVSLVAEAKDKVKYKKTQEVNFDGSDVDGVVRSPDGAYLLQKRGVKFNSLYKIDNQMEKNVLDSIHYLK